MPLQSVLIQIPDSSLGSIRIGSGNFSTDTDGVDQLTTVASTDFNQTNVYEVTREQIITGSVFFVANPSPLNAGKSVDLEFFVKDESGDLSDIPGLIRIGILEAPLSVQESIEESKYEPIFDAALGSDRFASIDVIISSIGVTREEALSEIRYSEQQRTISNDLNSTTEVLFAYSAQMKSSTVGLVHLISMIMILNPTQSHLF